MNTDTTTEPRPESKVKMEYLPSPHTERPNLLGYSQVALTDEDMKHVDTLVEEGDVAGLMDFMEARHIPYEGLDSDEEFRTRINMEYWRQRRTSHKQTVSTLLAMFWVPPPPPPPPPSNLFSEQCYTLKEIISHTD